ncbi:MAG TPA: amino acid ABC transporter substrate-binding protein [Desulfomonilaceae bacterium]|nr:amino acid ABC transporter substrate-binding protein [Desulfomonilaceae bacterium]
MQRKGIILLATALLFCFLSQAAILAEQAKPFKIGVAVSLTGRFGKDGTLVKDAYTLWMDKVNAQGGINGHPVEIIFYDDKSDAPTAAKLTEQLIESDKVDLLLGGFGSDAVFAASAVAEKRGYPLISGGASSNKLFERGFKYYFSTLGKATEEVRGCVDFSQAVQPKPKTAAIVGADILFTSLACEGFKKYCGENGIEVVHYELFPMTLEDYNSLLLKVKSKNPDLLLVGSHLLVAMKTMKALKEIDFSPKAVAFSYGPTVPKFIEELKGDAEYVLAASEWTPNMPYTGPVLGSARDFNNAYSEKFKRNPDYVEAASDGGALAQQMVIEKLGLKPPLSKKDRESIMEKLHAETFDTFYGKIHFGPDGANVAHPPVAVQIQNGKLMNVFPLEFAESKIWYPFKAWKER